MKHANIHRVQIIGAGTMGQQVAWKCAAHSYDVVIYNRPSNSEP